MRPEDHSPTGIILGSMAAGVFAVGAGWHVTSFNRAATARFRHKARRCRCWKIDKPALMRTMFDTERGFFHPAAAVGGVHHHGFDREELKTQPAQIGFSEAKDATAVRFSKRVEKGGEEEFSILLVTARRSRGEAW